MPLALITLGVAILAAVAVAGSGLARGLPRAEADFLRDLERYADWITEAREAVPPAKPGERVVELDSVKDLVGVAAESHSRVIFDRTWRTLSVYTPGAVYRVSKFARAAPNGLATFEVVPRPPPRRHA